MAFSLGAFAGGVGSGLEQGADLKQKYREAAAKALARKADQNYSAMLEQASKGAVQPVGGGNPGAPGMGAPTPSPPAAGGPPPGMGAPPPQQAMPRPVPMPGAQPMPGAGGSPAGAAPPQGMSLPQPRPAVPGAPPGGPPMGGQGAPSGGAPNAGDIAKDPMKQSQVIIQETAKQIAQAFPGKKWQPGELLATVDSVLQHSEAANPLVKQMAQLQIQWYANQIKEQNAGETARHHQVTEDLGQQKVDETQVRDEAAHKDRLASLATSLQRVQMAQSGADRRAQLGASIKKYVVDTQQAGATDRTQMVNDLRQTLADEGFSQKEQEDAIKLYAIDSATDAKNYAANPAGPVPAKPARPVLKKPLGGSSGGGGGQPPPQALQHLKEGQPTTFANGQTWTLKGGKPVRVK